MKTKNIFLIGVFLLTLIACFIPPLQAQQSVDPDRYKLYYTHPLVTDRAYANSTTDTIPNLVINHWAQAAHQKDRLGAASMLTLQITCEDSMYALVYVDELIGTVWTAVLTDSILSAVAYTKEFSLRSQAASSTAKLGGQFRARIYFPAWHTQGVADAVDSPLYTATWLWKS
jgi:hypothetical protein